MANDLIERAARHMLVQRAIRNLAKQGILDATPAMIGDPPETSMVVARDDVRAIMEVLTYAEAKSFREAKNDRGMQ